MADLILRLRATGTRTSIVIRRGALAALGRFVRRTSGARRVVVVSDPRVARLYGGAALRALRGAGITATLVTVPRGERAKSPREVERLWRRFARLELARADAVVALGGGVVGDLAGFAAATWLRGVPWIGVPTTVIAQVDSAIGGKTGVDLVAGKNLVGAFHHPCGVLVDPECLRTLPARHRRAGLAEVIKMGMAVDARLFTWVERNADRLVREEPAAWGSAVARALAVKARVVARDPYEGGARTALNFGHTLGHAIEAARGYRGVLHGEAVAIGMRAAVRLSVRVARLAPEHAARLEALLDRVGLPRRMPATRVRDLVAAMRVDKKRGRGDGPSVQVRWVLTPHMGHASVPRPVDGRVVRAAMLEVGAQI